MKTGLMAVLALALLSGPTLAAGGAKPTVEQKAEFYKTCYGISQDEALCTCKADAAMTLIDEGLHGDGDRLDEGQVAAGRQLQGV
jgi:hypothetical protein